MLKKLLSTAIVAALALVLPLAARPHLLLHWRAAAVASAILLLMLTQPAVASVRETSKADRHTLWQIMGLAILSVAAPVAEWAWLRPDPESTAVGLWPAIGLGLMAAGIGLRLWAIAVLGRWFTAEVRVQAGQPLVTRGPYRLVRHPSYAGAYLAFLGTALMLGAPLGLGIAAMAMFTAYRNRIRAEEAALAGHFGEQWAAFAAGRKRLVPLVW